MSVSNSIATLELGELTIPESNVVCVLGMKTKCVDTFHAHILDVMATYGGMDGF